jgi:hypothetical protein
VCPELGCLILPRPRYVFTAKQVLSQLQELLGPLAKRYLRPCCRRRRCSGRRQGVATTWAPPPWEAQWKDDRYGCW